MEVNNSAFSGHEAFVVLIKDRADYYIVSCGSLGRMRVGDRKQGINKAWP